MTAKALRQTDTAPVSSIASGGAPRLSAESSASDLLAAIQRNRGLLASLHGEASAAATRLLQNPHLAQLSLGVAEFWNAANWEYRSALPRERLGEPADASAWSAASVAALRVILQARDALVGLAADVQRLGHADMLVLRGDVAGAAADELRAGIAARLPGLGRWQEMRRAAAEAAQARQEQERAQQAEGAAANMAAKRAAAALELLGKLASRGLSLVAVGEQISVVPAPLLAESDRAAIAEYRAELSGLLAAEPVLI